MFFMTTLVDGESLGAPWELICAMIKELFPANDERNLSRLASQTSPRLKRLADWLKHTDCLIVDTNYDLSAPLVEIAYRGENLRFVNIHMAHKMEFCRNIRIMPLEVATLKYQCLFYYILNINPALRIVFLHYPVTGFEIKGGHDLRVRRARELAETVALSRVVSIPLVKIGDGDFGAIQPEYYFSERVYAA